MKIKLLAILVCLAMLLGVLSCGTSKHILNPVISDTAGISFGTDSTFDIATWNIENYPKHDPQTSQLLADLIPKLKLDCIAIEEIMNATAFSSLLAQLPGWNAVMTTSSSSYRLALLYNTSEVSVDSTATIYTNLSVPFPRPPLVVKVRWRNTPVYVIVNHLKAYGDNVIEMGNNNDEEYRRLLACQYLDQYVQDNLPAQRVIILGDMNDQIQEPAAYNVFTPFLDRPLDYEFTDMTIAEHLTQQNCSYPNSTSHIDHILITNELFDSFTAAGCSVKSLNIENYIGGGFSTYDSMISDHRPVAARFGFGR